MPIAGAQVYPLGHGELEGRFDGRFKSIWVVSRI
jgi:hypothetical protein